MRARARNIDCDGEDSGSSDNGSDDTGSDSGSDASDTEGYSDSDASDTGSESEGGTSDSDSESEGDTSDSDSFASASASDSDTNAAACSASCHHQPQHQVHAAAETVGTPNCGGGRGSNEVADLFAALEHMGKAPEPCTGVGENGDDQPYGSESDAGLDVLW